MCPAPPLREFSFCDLGGLADRRKCHEGKEPLTALARAILGRLDGAQVDVVGRDRVRAGQLVLAVGPVLAGVGEPGPRLVVRRGGHQRVVRGPLGERRRGFFNAERPPVGYGNPGAQH